MKKQKENIREPFEPEDTPKPPQIIEPNSGRERENPVEDEQRTREKSSKERPGTKDAKPHLMSEEADINDETTI